MAQLSKSSIPTSEPVRRGFSLPCPMCGEASALIRVNLSDVNDLHCSACDNDFTLEDVRRFIAQWGKAISWLESCPALE